MSMNSELKIKCLPLSSGLTEPLGPSIWTSPNVLDTDRHWQQFLSSKFKVGVQDNCFRFAWFQDCLPVCTHHPPHFMDKNDLLQCINSALVIACNFKVKKEMLSLLSENIDDTDDSRHCKRNKRKLKQMDWMLNAHTQVFRISPANYCHVLTLCFTLIKFYFHCLSLRVKIG